ncbi:glycoside hydrolase superfamily [Xylaria arbuscula]|nr:glycoside hydrolase superfamily [Xylaria arbuscula]
MHLLRLLAWAIVSAFAASADDFRNVMYIDEWHPTIPNNGTITNLITHVIMAFVDPLNFTTPNYAMVAPPLMSVDEVRAHFDNDTKIGIALGGWGAFSSSFSLAAAPQNRSSFSCNLASWMDEKGYDFVDIDWEYPGGHGAQEPSNATADIENFPMLLSEIRKALKPEKFISLAASGTLVGMDAFKTGKMEAIYGPVDFITVMSYDYVNRVSQKTGHHTDVEGSKVAVQRYLDLGVPPGKLNLGFAFYAKYFQVMDGCTNFTTPDSCEIVPAQDANGVDNYKSGVLTFEPNNLDPQPVPASLIGSVNGVCGIQKNTQTGLKCPESYCCSQDGWCGDSTAHCLPSCQRGYGRCDGPDDVTSFKRARENFQYDATKGGLYYFDNMTTPMLFWTWENTDMMTRKFDEIVNNPNQTLGGISAWSLGENSFGWDHVLQMQNMTRIRNAANSTEGGGEGEGECLDILE